MTDRQLIEAFVHADAQDFRHEEVFGVFVERHQGAMLSFAASFLRDDTLAQDVVQEAFLRAARFPQRILQFGEGEKAGSERNWLLKVVRDLSIDSLRRRASEKKAVDRRAETVERSSPAADVNAEKEEQNAQVRRAIDTLKPRYRELLILKVREQKSYREIAQITGLTVTNVGFLLHQAMQELTEELKRVTGDE